MDDLTLEKIAISGPTLASMIQRFSFSTGAVDGLLFGHFAHVAFSNLSDDSPPPSSSDSSSSPLVAFVSGFICSGTINSFYDSAGRIDTRSLSRLLGDAGEDSRETLIGWFSGRRRTNLRPSLREFSVTASLSASDRSVPVRNAPTAASLLPCVFLVLASPIQDQAIHTHEYRAHQFRPSAKSLEPKSIDVVNIGPAFRGHYGSFIPKSPLPLLPCDLRASPMSEDRDEESQSQSQSQSLGRMKQVSRAQRELDLCAQGLEVSDLRKLMGNEAVSYMAGLEDLYEKMLAKIETLARLVEKSSTRVLEQENHNRKLRLKIARSAGLE